MALTRMPRAPNSVAAARVRALRPALAAGVDDRERRRVQRRLGADVDHRAPGSHVLRGEGGQPQGAFEVHRDRLVEQLRGHVQQRRGHGRDAGVVDQDVDPPELGDRDVDQRRALVPVADVAAHRQRPATQGLDLRDHPVARRELAAGDDHVGPRLGEAQGHGPSEALAPAGDDHDLAIGPEGRDGHLSPRRERRPARSPAGQPVTARSPACRRRRGRPCAAARRGARRRAPPR